MENKAYNQEPPPGYSAQPAGQPPNTVIVTQPVATTTIISNPPNYFALSIFSCLFCFWPTGLLAIYYSMQTNNLTSSGDVAGAARASKNAKTLSIVGIAVGCLFILILIILAATGSLVSTHYSYGLSH